MFFDKSSTGFNLVTHEGSKYFIRSNSILYFYLEQTTRRGIHCSFPKLFRIHLAKPFVALFDHTAFGFLTQPPNRITEMADGLLFTTLTLATINHASRTYQPHQGITRLLQRGVIRAQYKISIKNTDLDIAV